MTYSYKEICKVNCGNEFGTGFFIDSTTILTASHTLNKRLENENEPISIQMDETGKSFLANPLNQEWKSNPISILKIEDSDEHPRMSALTYELAPEDGVKTIGFVAGQIKADCYKLEVSRKFDNLELEENCDVYLRPVDRQQNFEGLSGAPLLYKESLIGLVLRQKLEGQTAVRLEAITGLNFRECIQRCGLKIPTINPSWPGTEFHTLQQIPTSRNISEINSLMDSHFESILDEHERGEIVSSWEKFGSFLEELPKSSCSPESKGKYYLCAALWTLRDGKAEEADNYILKAKEANPSIDIRTYTANKYISCGNLGAAKVALKPVNSLDTCNAYLECLLLENAPIQQGLNLLDFCGISPNAETHRLLALLALSSNDYSTARGQIDLARQHAPESIAVIVGEALINFWSAINNLFPTFAPKGFIDVSGYFSPSDEQKKYLGAAYDQLSGAYEKLHGTEQNQLKTVVLWGLVLVAQLLPDKDYMIWLSIIEESNPNSPDVLSFKIRHHLPIAEKTKEWFLTAEDDALTTTKQLLAKLQLYIQCQMYNQALQFYDLHADALNPGAEEEKALARMELLLECKKLDELQESLKKTNITNAGVIRLGLGLKYASGEKITQKDAKKAFEFSKKSGNPIDFWNANLICIKAKDWKTQERNAKEWFTITQELYALELRAEALYQQGRCKKALRVIERAEALGDNSNRLRQSKITCLTGLSKFEDAIKIVETGEGVKNNATLVLMQTDSYIALGNPDKAQRILEDFVDSEQYNFEVYARLIALEKSKNPDKAFSHAYNYYLHNPSDKRALRLAGMVGVETEHYEVHDKFFQLLYNDSNKEGYVKTLKTTELLEYLEEESRRVHRVAEEHKETNIPIHAAITGNLGATLLNNWENSKYQPAHFIQYPKNLVHLLNDIVLDYTSCITLASLDLIEGVCKLYSRVWISGALLIVWLEDIQQLENIQRHVVERNQALYSALQRLKFTHAKIDMTQIKSDSKYSRIYELNSQYAEQYNAYIIDRLNPTSIDGKAIPSKWYDRCIPKECLYHALKVKDLPHPNYDEKVVKDEFVQKICHKCNIILDTAELEELDKAGALDTVFEIYHVIVTEQTLNQISEFAREEEKRKNLAEKLKSYYKKIADLVQKKKISQLPTIQRRGYLSDNKYMKLFENEVVCAMTSRMDLACDDRFCTKYKQISGEKGTSSIFSSYDLINEMYNSNYINKIEFFSILDVLLEKNYCYFIPPAEYVYNRLRLVELGDLVNGKQTRALKNVAKSIAFAQSKKCGMDAVKNYTPELQQERISYFLSLHHLLENILQLIWQTKESDIWKKQASDWVLLAFNNSFSSSTNNFSFSFKSAYFEVGLIMAGIKLMGDLHQKKSTRIVEYFKWLFQYLRISWGSDPQLKREVAAIYCDLITQYPDETSLFDEVLTGKEAKLEIERSIKYLKIVFTAHIPKDLLDLILKDSRMNDFLSYYSKYKFSAEDVASWGAIEFDESVFNKEILKGEDDVLENALRAVADNPQKNGDVLLNDILDDIDLESLSESLKIKFMRFLSVLSWYLPGHLGDLAQEKKFNLILFSC